ncbi:MAG: transglutaminase-like domain-containing protein [Acidobacteriota bacterium]
MNAPHWFAALWIVLAAGVPAAADDPAAHLSATDYLDHGHPRVQQAIAEATRGATTPREKAVAIHDYVRDRVAFGFNKPFYAMRASEVLAAGRGFCNNQSTVFAAMLRGAGVPARHRFYALSAQVLDGILDPGTPYVDHAVVEVHLDDRWVPVDSYIVDRPLAEAVRPQLTSGLRLGVRADGSTAWDGATPSFSQFHPEFVAREFGVFEDVDAFYARAERPTNRLGVAGRLLFRLVIGRANDRIETLRTGAP